MDDSKKRSISFFPWLIPLISFFVGIAAGLMIHAFWSDHEKTASGSFEIHEQGYNLINPLLKCEGAAETIGDRELRPFQQSVEVLVRNMERSGRAKNMAVYFRDLNNGPWFGIGTEERFSPASLLKVPIMIALLKQAESDPGALTKKIKYRGGKDLNAQVNIKGWRAIARGKSYTVEELISMMIEHSDNNARELLRANMYPGLLTKIYSDLGIYAPLVETEDFMTVRSYATFFRVLYNASYLSKEMSHKAMTYLAGSDYKEGIVAGVPSTIPVAHKFGERTIGDSGIKQLHDCGIVYYPNSPYLLCIMSRGLDFGRLAQTISAVSRLVYEEVDRQRR